MSAAQTYLVAHNGAMLAGWTAVGAKIAAHLLKGGALNQTFGVSRWLVKRLLLLSCLEIVHAATKLVRSPVGPTAVQCLVRLFAFLGAMDLGSKDVEKSHWATQTMIAWAISEMIRYGFYLSGLVRPGHKAPHWLTWLRYSAFVLLYPIGISGEMGCFYKAIPFIRAKSTATITLPNRANFSFDYARFIQVMLICFYPAGAYKLYSYMLKQRQKALM
jgi:very-long-chain (3R)-3-hydroxyacyl-CoA dehydratase